MKFLFLPFSPTGHIEKYILTVGAGFVIALLLQFAFGVISTAANNQWNEVIWLFHGVLFMGTIYLTLGLFSAVAAFPLWILLHSIFWRWGFRSPLLAPAIAAVLSLMVLFMLPVLSQLSEGMNSNVNLSTGFLLAIPISMGLAAYFCFVGPADNENKNI